MKNLSAYIFILFAFAGFTLLIVHFRNPAIQYELKLRGGQSVTSPEWANTRAAIENLLERVRLNEDDNKSKTELAFAFIQESRISGNHAYYDPAALSLFEDVLSDEPNNYLALTGKSTVLLSQHHFQEAIPPAIKARQINPYGTAALGVLTDAYVETGNYERAIETADSMAALRPDLRSYSRISYLREIVGDIHGAIQAMNMAVDAAIPGTEQAEWSRVQLGRLYENTGDLYRAEFCYDASIFYRPSFAWAYEGKARIEKAKKNYTAAISYCRKAQALLNDFSFQQELTEIYRITGQQELAAVSARKTIELLGGMQMGSEKNNHGHYADRELALAYLDAYDYLNAYKHAVTEYNRRPDNIDVNHTLAWVSYKLGRYEKANHYINCALRTHSKNPILNYQAGLIKLKSGESKTGSNLIKEAITLNPFLPASMTHEAKEILATN
jgi:tetratricopeptide (TPR) repeat protein